MSEEMLVALDDVYANANRLVASVRDDQWEQPTPCAEWNVRQLVDHMTGTSRVCHAAATRTAPQAVPDADAGGAASTGAAVAGFAAASAETAAAWRGAGALDGMVSVPADMPAIAALGVNIIDIGTHAWDLATAIGEEVGLTPEMVALIDDWNHKIVSDDIRAGGGFGSALEPASDDPLVKMLAFVGRQA